MPRTVAAIAAFETVPVRASVQCRARCAALCLHCIAPTPYPARMTPLQNAECHMESQTLSIACPVTRTPSRRLIDELRSAAHRVALLWRQWKQRREHDSTLQMLAGLDMHTLKDIGIPHEFRARAAALHEARNDRLAELMR
jgi:uncharacterized protein YjiS (DUF1127 family)